VSRGREPEISASVGRNPVSQEEKENRRLEKKENAVDLISSSAGEKLGFFWYTRKGKDKVGVSVRKGGERKGGKGGGHTSHLIKRNSTPDSERGKEIFWGKRGKKTQHRVVPPLLQRERG